jgi:hypothetical protein
MPEIAAILIDPTRPDRSGATRINTTLEHLRHHVGGDIEAVYGYRRPDNTETEAPRVTFICNENGKCLLNDHGRPTRLALNAHATGLYWHYNALVFGEDVFVGTVLVFGGIDEDGEMLPVPQHVVDVHTSLVNCTYAEQYSYLATTAH